MHWKHPMYQTACLLLAYIICLLFSISPHFSVHAQFQPVLAFESSSAFIEGRGLYVLGGFNAAPAHITQTFMIDLSIPWNTTRPAYKTLPLGPTANWFASALSVDGQKWFALTDGTGQVLDFQSNEWVKFFTSPGARVFGLAAASGPETEKVYIPFGYLNQDGLRSMMIVDLKDKSYSTDNITSSIAPQNVYTFTWNAYLKSFLFANRAGMYKYTPSSGWMNFNGPQELLAREGNCMVSSGSGSKVVLFGGGIIANNPTFGDIFILDVPTLTWKKGPSTSPEDARRSCACAISNDYFIAWGGQVRNDRPVIAPKQMTLVYDLKTDKWVSDYIAPTTIPTTTIPTATNPPGNDVSLSPSTSSDSKIDTAGSPSLIGLIVGAICGGLTIGLIAGIAYGYRDRKSRVKSSTSDNPVYMNGQTNKFVDDEDRNEETSRGMKTVQLDPFKSYQGPQSLSTHYYTAGYDYSNREKY
ncbi:MAG: hypothetical protein J3Q66DRAFT_359962 [Benniella sp.]|nr:MAG: hypothetical protein J3Q66DRAFT_359962 [Benniella sp.]